MQTNPGEIASLIESKLHRYFNRTPATAAKHQVFRAAALVLRDLASGAYIPPPPSRAGQEEREIHYLSLEFLLGRSLEKNAFNLQCAGILRDALGLLGLDYEEIVNIEPDAGLGNGGLGRLAACYLESMTTLGLHATGYSLCYEFGIFKQKILDGEQIELPDPWLDLGDVWLVTRSEEAQRVRFGGRVECTEENGQLSYRHVDYSEVLAVPRDMSIIGYGLESVNTLRLWDAKSPMDFDMQAFSRGDYMKALEQTAMAEVINKVLYPEDNHMEGKLLRLRQQYFFVSATVQSVAAKHRQKYGTLANFHEKHILHINDTHPTLVIPELMRILLDDEGMPWDKAWHIVTRCVAYTNHTVLSEALECWPQNIVEMLLPRIWQILCEINDRYVRLLWELFRDEVRVSAAAVIWDGQVRMANLCVYACFSINGVSALHSKILCDDVFRIQSGLWPHKFRNVTNGIDHRRWLAQINPSLHTLICNLLGDDAYLRKPDKLRDLRAYTDDDDIGAELCKIKRQNKENMASWVYREQGLRVDPASIFDVQVKRLHEYKRQLLNVLHIVHLYNRILDDPDLDIPPRTFFFGAKAASGYYMAKRIIRLINSVAAHINNDKRVGGRLKVVFLENYRVSLAGLLMPASEVSEQISTAGLEASGTGNMKFMMNGALTLGTMDGANVEICEMAGEENNFIFGLRSHEVAAFAQNGYDTRIYLGRNPALRRVLDQLTAGFDDGVEYGDIVHSLLIGQSVPDKYRLLADFDAYCLAQERVGETYRDSVKWNHMSLENIAASGFFASDRSIEQYAKNIWHVKGRAM